MADLAPSSPPNRSPLDGDPAGLLTRIGLPSDAESPSFRGCLASARIRDASSLRAFLREYRDQVLVPIELPAVKRAQEHASRGEGRELIRLDQALANEPRLKAVAEASRAVGRSQLRRLLPMKDQRQVQRYWQAVERGEAQAWHPVVYGVVLGVYCLPLRQGLIHYAYKSMTGFIRAAAEALRLSEADLENLRCEFGDQLPGQLGQTLLDRQPLLTSVG